jgi:filamentous hemagglutinin
MGPKSGHIIRHRGIIRAAQSRRWINAISALILAGTMTAPAYAGDILRGGATRANDAVRAQALANTGQAQALKLRANAQDRLARTTQTLQSMQAAQAAARSAAAAVNNVANGLAPGGLEVLTGGNARWDGADAPVAVGNDVNIKQNDPQAVLHWKTFNVGRDTTVNFDQSKGGADAGKWIAFNKVFDPSAAPSQIRGRINAQGQVYILNQNGIVFSGSSQINTRALVASSLPINDNFIARGLLNQAKIQSQYFNEFLFSAVPDGAFTPPGAPASGRYGDVVVERGAQIRSTVNAEGSGGRVMLAGPNVRNDGSIATPSGQTILVAGQQIGIQAHSSTDPSLRGLDVFVGKVEEGSGSVVNNGLIDVATGNLTLAGKSLVQNGAVRAMTSVSLNGRIDLQASYDAVRNVDYDPVDAPDQPAFLLRKTGGVNFGPGAVTDVLPDLISGDKNIGTALPLRSRINITGRDVVFGPGSIVRAPSGDLGISAGEWSQVSESVDGKGNTVYQRGDPNFVYANGSVLVGRGALLDVAGAADVFVPLAQSVLDLQLRGSEMAVAPLQRDGEIRGATITVDIRKDGYYRGRYWIGTPLGDATGFANIIERNAAQLSANGGSITMRAGASITAESGSVLDVSGGYFRNEGGRIETTRLTLPGGRLIDIADAAPDQIYQGIFAPVTRSVSDKWGVVKSFRRPLAPTGAYDQTEFLSGASGGRLSLTAPRMDLGGVASGDTVIGPYQARRTELTSRLENMAGLRLDFTGQSDAFPPGSGVLYPTVSPRPVSVLFGGSGGIYGLLGNSATSELVFSPDFFARSGFGHLELENAEGDYVVAEGTTLALPEGGSLVARGRNFRVNGSILAPGGRVALTAYTFSPYQADILKANPDSAAPDFDPSNGSIDVSRTGRISAAGLLVDDLYNIPSTGFRPYVIDGGAINLTGFNVRAKTGSILDVSGGAAVSSEGDFRYGNGGSLTLAAGNDPKLPSLLGGELALGGTLAGYSGKRGGTLDLTAPLVQIGGSRLRASSLLLDPAFFTSGGFNAFKLTGLGVLPKDLGELNKLRTETGSAAAPDYFLPAVSVAAGTVIRPVAESHILSFGSSDGNRGLRLDRIVHDSPVLRDPISLSFNAPGIGEDFNGIDAITGETKTAGQIKIRGDIVLGTGSLVAVEPRAEVFFAGQTVSLFGSVSAPAGTIRIVGGNSFPSMEANPGFARTTVHVGADARLSAAGALLAMPGEFGRLRGEVLPGGTINISGNILAEKDSVLDVSGARGSLDLTPGERGLLSGSRVAPNTGLNTLPLPRRFRTVSIESDAGTLQLQGKQMLVNEATMRGSAGGASASSGTLGISSGRFYLPTDFSTSADASLRVTQTGQLLLSSAASRGAGFGVVDSSGATLKGSGFFSVDQMSGGGFGSLALGGNPDFRGAVSINLPAALDVASGGLIRADADVRLQARYIKLGQNFRPPLLPADEKIVFAKSDPVNPEFNFAPTHGTGRLIATAEHIDLGNLSLGGIGRLELNATGSIRGNGTVQIAGSMLLQSASVNPVTGASLGLFAYDGGGGPGSITFRRNGTPTAPLSAAGSINVQAASIEQGGVLHAPFGSITLGWDGAGTAPVNPIAKGTIAAPVTQSLVLAADSITSVAGVDPVTGREMLVPYGVSFDGLSWIDPSGQDITDGQLLPSKQIHLAGQSVDARSGSLVDLRGGGDLFAYQWVPGNTGPIDLLSSDPQYQDRDFLYGTSRSYAVLPGYAEGMAPFAPFNNSGLARKLDGANGRREAGYVHEDLGLGDRVYLSGGAGLGAGFYTLLPAHYALLSGAFLVTPFAGQPGANFTMADGSGMVAGYRLDGLAARSGGSRAHAVWEVVPSGVLSTRAEYNILRANDFLPARAKSLGLAGVARLPQDSGYLRVQGNEYLRLDGAVLARPTGPGRGAWADVSTSKDIEIRAADGAASLAGAVLSSPRISSYGIESLLLGGRRTSSGLEVNAQRMTLNNDGASLQGPDVTLAASKGVILLPGSSLKAAGPVSGTTENLQVYGDGAAVRVVSSVDIGLSRLSPNSGSSEASLSIGGGAQINGGSITLDSSDGFLLDPDARISGSSLEFGAGQVAVQLSGPTLLVGQLDPAVTQLTLSAQQLSAIPDGGRLSLRSYGGAIDLYGLGSLGSPSLSQLSLETAVLRGFDQGPGAVELMASRVSFSNPNKIVASLPSGASEGSFKVKATTFESTGGDVAISRYASGLIDANRGISFSGNGSLSFGGDLTAVTPGLVATKGASQTLSSTGQLVIADSSTVAGSTSGLGASLKLEGASVMVNSDVFLPSGQISLSATGPGGEVRVGGRLDVSGVTLDFFDAPRFSDGGSIRLAAADGDVSLMPGSLLAVSSPLGGGAAGSITVSSPRGIFTDGGTLLGSGGSGGNFSLDAVGVPRFTELGNALNDGGFSGARSLRVRSGDLTVSGTTRVTAFRLTLDSGSITVDGVIDASGVNGGSIDLLASGNIDLDSGTLLDVSGASFDNAGKGGSVSLEAGSAVGGVADQTAAISIAAGSAVDLRVEDYKPGDAADPSSSAFQGRFTGTLSLRAPRTGAGAGSGIGIGEIQGDILGASSILAEGFKIYQAATGTITSSIQSQIHSEASAYLGASGSSSAGYTAMLSSILASRPELADVFVLAPGAEIVSTSATGDLVLGTTSSTSTSDWNLSTFRYGPKAAPGVLTMRAPRDIILYNAISDGFAPTSASSNGSWLWLAPLAPVASSLPRNTQSWSYRFTAGADLSSADYRGVLAAGAVPSGNGGSLRLGKNYGNAVFSTGNSALTSTALNNRFQVIRTGTGDIDISAAQDIVLLNQFASIYTAGSRLADYSSIFSSGDFALPTILDSASQGAQLGVAQRSAANPYFVQYSMAGGDIRLAAGRDLHRTTMLNDIVIDDPSRQLPSNWLYRRGYVDPVTGEYGIGGYQSGPSSRFPDPASTTWWVDFSNFFAGVGTLGGGDILLESGGDIRNFDAAIPTTARAPKGRPDATKLHETGGGNLMVRAGGNLDGGVYYVERGEGVLQARGSITTNPARSLSRGNIDSPAVIADPLTWLPTTLFLGKGNFEVAARGDVLLGPVANAFLLPPGINNRYWNKSYFSTYAPDSLVRTTSLGGTITHRTEAQLSQQGSPRPLLALWAETQHLLRDESSSNFQPWLRLSETLVEPFDPLALISAPSMVSTAFSGDINLAGDLRLFPSPIGTVEFVAGGAINGLQPLGLSDLRISGQSTRVWKSATVNLSDADPGSLPGAANPLSATAVVGRSASRLQSTESSVFGALVGSFSESGSYSGANASAAYQKALHGATILHRHDDLPLRLYAAGGNLEGLTLFAPKFSRILAARDVADVALYLQNARAEDTSMVASARDILPYSVSGPLRVLSSQGGNAVVAGQGPLAGDIQISGPGRLDVIAGRNLDLGTGPNNADGTATGITGIGNLRNPSLSFAGADILVAAGLSGADLGHLQIDAFLAAYGNNVPPGLDPEERAHLAVRTLFDVLARAAKTAAGTGSYDEGYSAIDALFGNTGTAGGDIITHSRELKTRTGGSITALAPGGGIRMASNIIGEPLAPPGIVSEYGGAVSVLTKGNVDIGKGRIFTLRGGDITIWSSDGDIAAGTSAKTVVTAPPTRVIIDAQSAEVATDLGGLATGGGIGVLASVEGVPPGSVNLIAPRGTVDAGDAGIRATGDITIAAAQVLNADNITAGGASVGGPSAPASAPSFAGLSSSSSSTAATSSAASEIARQGPAGNTAGEQPPSTVTVEVLGYGGGEGSQPSGKEEDDRQARSGDEAVPESAHSPG